MDGRRHLVRIALGAAALTLGAASGRGASAEDELAAAGDFVQRAGNELAQLAPQAKASPGGRERLRQFVDTVVDVDGVARFCIGRYWRTASPAQQERYLALFHQVLFLNVTARLGDYSAETAKVEIGRPQRAEGGISVPTVVERAGNKPARVVWAVEPTGAGMRITDVVVEGMSMRLALRGDYTSFIARSGGDVNALLDAMQRQVSQPVG